MLLLTTLKLYHRLPPSRQAFGDCSRYHLQPRRERCRPHTTLWRNLPPGAACRQQGGVPQEQGGGLGCRRVRLHACGQRNPDIRRCCRAEPLRRSELQGRGVRRRTDLCRNKCSSGKSITQCLPGVCADGSVQLAGHMFQERRPLEVVAVKAAAAAVETIGLAVFLTWWGTSPAQDLLR